MQLDYKEAHKVLKEYQIDFPKYEMAASKKEAVRIAKNLGFPVVLKITSQKIIHKSDVKGVKLDLRNTEEVEKAYDEIMSKVSNKDIDGILVQKMILGNYILIGMKRDESFGPVIAFGLGGIFVEVMKDVSFRIAPITTKDAKEMIKEIKGHKLLEGFRGSEKVDFDKLVELLLNVSKLSMENKDIKEIDFNPVVVNSKEAMVVDVRFIK
ncbi:MAG: acetate--CoA ligase family protein [Nanoarchaeota archaeon]|nr:acetate--CoA ligase family protein [Nanoarchaeota archaeon]MBU4352669.1 acetate--CoA ligase family protein [Nanoarchaeota archaeon]MBU4456926.1 acetate--CoA ligase family protein [Nanoarchaeota archaeon]MCG2719203.1 acetate--CoA ligase family protein [Nanoarchaeota archaeon]